MNAGFFGKTVHKLRGEAARIIVSKGIEQVMWLIKSILLQAIRT